MITQNEKISTIFNIIEDIYNVEINCFESEAQINDFCKRHQVIDQQYWLASDALRLILEKGNRNRISFFEDVLHVRIILFYFENSPIIIGPYLSEKMTAEKCIRRCNEIRKKELNYKDLVVYYGKFPVISYSQVSKMVVAITRGLGIGNLQENYISYKGSDTEGDKKNDLEYVSNHNIELHYCTERKYMEAIKKGNIREARFYKNQLAEWSSGIWRKDGNLEARRMGYAINRAMSRIAAYEAGIPAPIIHQITMKESMTISAAQNEKQMELACDEMLYTFCEIIRSINNKKYSAMVQSIIYSINQKYAEEMSVREIAEELDVSESYMIAQFKKETGTTPAAFLRDTRLKFATKLLISTDEEIQRICGKVGIHDANYFVKVFKSKYGMTPKSYRKKYKI